MTAFEKMRVDQLLGVIDKCCLSYEELRELSDEVYARYVRKGMQIEREAQYGKPKDGRRNARRRRKTVPLSQRLSQKVAGRKNAGRSHDGGRKAMVAERPKSL